MPNSSVNGRMLPFKLDALCSETVTSCLLSLRAMGFQPGFQVSECHQREGTFRAVHFPLNKNPCPSRPSRGSCFRFLSCNQIPWWFVSSRRTPFSD